MNTSPARWALLAAPAAAALLAATVLLRPPAVAPLKPEKYIAHGAGTVGGRPCTSSLEALNESYRNRFRFIELDFNWTTDNELALVHDWERVSWLFNGTAKEYSLADFMKLKMAGGLTQNQLTEIILFTTLKRAWHAQKLAPGMPTI